MAIGSVAPPIFLQSATFILLNQLPKYRVLLLCLLIIMSVQQSYAQFWKRKAPAWPRSETELANKLVECLARKDTAAYYDLFPPFDTLWNLVLHNPDKSPEAQRDLGRMKEHPQILVEFDPLYNKSIIGRYAHILQKGEDSGVVWNNILMARFQLHQVEVSSVLRGFERIAPERFNGYLFVSDAYNRRLFCISVQEIQKIGNRFFGGQFINILEASTIEEFNKREQEEQRYFDWIATHPDTVKVDTAMADSAGADTTADPLLLTRSDVEDDDDVEMRHEVVDRKYYEGLMDNEIPIRLYVRYMRPIAGKPRQYDGLYKLGDKRRYLRLDITRDKDGKWLIEDETATGLLELMLNGNTYTGAWTNADDNGYDVVLTQTALPEGKMELLDRIIDQGASGKVDEARFEEGNGKGSKSGKSKRKKDKASRKKKESGSKKEQGKNERKKDKGKKPDDSEKSSEKQKSNTPARSGQSDPWGG